MGPGQTVQRRLPVTDRHTQLFFQFQVQAYAYVLETLLSSKHLSLHTQIISLQILWLAAAVSVTGV